MGKRILVREITPADASLWTRLGAIAYNDCPYSLDDVVWPAVQTVAVDAQRRHLVASFHGRDVGRLLLEHRSIADLCVEPNARRQGVATALVEAAMRMAARQGMPELRWHLYLDDENSGAVALFKSLGFCTAESNSFLIPLNLEFHERVTPRADRARRLGVRLRPVSFVPDALRVLAQVRHRAMGRWTRHVPYDELLVRKIRAGLQPWAGLAEVGDVPVGLLLGYAHVNTRDGRFVREAGVGLLADVGVVPEARGRGIASLLALAFADWLRAQGIERMWYGGAGGPQSMGWKLAHSLADPLERRRHTVVWQSFQEQSR